MIFLYCFRPLIFPYLEFQFLIQRCLLEAWCSWLLFYSEIYFWNWWDFLQLNETPVSSKHKFGAHFGPRVWVLNWLSRIKSTEGMSKNIIALCAMLEILFRNNKNIDVSLTIEMRWIFMHLLTIFVYTEKAEPLYISKNLICSLNKVSYVTSYKECRSNLQIWNCLKE
jgi:hypothetical protein